MSDPNELQSELWKVTDQLGAELIALTPDFMNEIQFEIVATDDGGADIGLMDFHPEVKYVALSPLVYELCSRYLRLVRNAANGWRRSHITLRQQSDNWKCIVDYEYE